MAKTDIWMPLYIGDYLADTMHLTCEQHGVYMLLLMAYWRKGCPLPSNDMALAATCRLSIDAWSTHKAVLMQFFDTSSGIDWVHHRVEKEMALAIEKKEKAVDKAKKAAEAKWNKARKCLEHDTSNASGVLDSCPSPSPSPSQAPEPKQSSARGTRLPADWTLPEDWKAVAKTIRADWPDHHVQRVADGFRDYWIAQPGQKGVKTDWLATWRNWCRRDTTVVYPAPSGPGTPPPTGMRKIPMMPMPGRKAGGEHG